MKPDCPIRRDVLHGLAALPFTMLLTQVSEVSGQEGGSPAKVDTKRLIAKIKFEGSAFWLPHGP
jgi:hypothetical protein